MAEKKNLIRELIETGKRNGKLTTKEINDAIEESGFDMEQIDKLLYLRKHYYKVTGRHPGYKKYPSK